MAENIEFPKPDDVSMAYDTSRNRFLTNAEYAELIVKTAAAAAPAESADTGTDTETPRKRKRAAATVEFNDAAIPVQFKLPADLARTLKLLSIQQGKSMSEIVLEALTSETIIRPVWISTRKAS
jgi:hypothetical protein